jgi:putative heme transporter
MANVKRRLGGRRTGAAVKTVLHWLLVVVALCYIGYQTPALLHSTSAAADELRHLHWGWVAAAAVLALASVAAYAEVHRRLLAVGGASPPASAVQSITFAENGINNTVPVVGGAGSLAYAISRLRRCGVDSALAAWAVLLAAVLDIVSLLALAAIGLAATGRVPIPVAVLAVAVLTAGSAGAWVVVTHPAVLHRLLRPVLWLDRFVPGTCRTCRRRRAADLDSVINRVAARLALLRPSPRQWIPPVVLCVLSWLLDFGNLAASAAATSQPVPWSALVTGFLVVQASIALQLFPGGAGLAEIGLLGVLLAAGVAPGPAGATVLIYRVSSWLLTSVVGWLAYGVHIHVIRPRPHRHQLQPAVG